MTIEEIGYTEKRMKSGKRTKEKSEEQKRYRKLMKDFNKKAEELNSPYRILLSYEHPHLNKIVKKKILFWEYEEKIELNQLVYLNWSNNNYFVFCDGLNIKTFKEIEDILNSIDIRFEVKLKSGKIPTKYKIIEELEK